jgi:hypothetical protein
MNVMAWDQKCQALKFEIRHRLKKNSSLSPKDNSNFKADTSLLHIELRTA